MNYPVEERKPLFENERKDLAKAVNGFGNMRKVARLSGVSDATIRHAIGGFNVNPDIRLKLRKYLEQINQPA